MYFILGNQGELLYADSSNVDCANWTTEPAPQPCWNPVFKGKRNPTTGEWVGEWHDDGVPTQQFTEEELCTLIDNAADATRAAVVGGDSLRAFEYERSAVEAQQFKDQGYPLDIVPRTVAAWAINGRSAQEAADSILQEATTFNEVLYRVREARLSGKEAVRSAISAGQPDQAVVVAEAAIRDIRAVEAAISGAGTA
ncbi:phage tail protein [Pseudomonas syringae]|uniref:phage tail protein n=1 Tax=Pseudomonas syringae TaxID=317 RepID=UPI000EFF81C4|nr:phage tail protein [Pseudomonas azotoformans]